MPARSESSTRALDTAAVALGALLLLAAALYNRYPLTFWDTRVYLEHMASLLPRPDRLIGYSVWLRVWSGGVTLWPAAIAQCVLVAWLVRRTLAAMAASASRKQYLTLMLALTLGTALPWVAGQLMADVFTPVLVLCLWLLVFDATLRRAERVLLAALVALCVSVHLTHLPLGLALVGVGFVLARATRETKTWRRLLVPVLALFTGLSAIAGLNYARSGKLTLASGSNAFILAHLVETGLASTVLDEHCPARGYLLCPYRAQLPMNTDAFLWVDKLDIEPWTREAAIKAETRRLLHDSLLEHPLAQLETAFVYSFGSFCRFGTGEGLDSDARYLIEPLVKQYVPRDLPAYRAARQQHDQIPIAALRHVHTPIGWALLALAGYVLAAAVARKVLLSAPSVHFLCFVVAALVLNAVLSGNLSGIYDRYESRLWWLLGLGLFAYWQRGANKENATGRRGGGKV